VEETRREDQELIGRVASGDRDALASLYDRHSGTMMAIGLKILRAAGEAEDVLHDVFLEAWGRAGTYDATKASVRVWLHLRMRSRCLDRVKSARWKRSESLSTREHARAAVPPVVEAAADASLLRAALTELPEEQRMALALGYFGGLSSREIAEHMGIPTGTVKSRVAAAIGKLRATLLEET